MQARAPVTDWPSILMVVLCAICILFLVASSGLLIFSGLFQILTPSSFDAGGAAAASSILLGIGLAFVGLLIIPALYYNWQRLYGKPIPEASIKPIRTWQVLILLAISLAAIFLGNLVLQEVIGVTILAPLFYLLAVILPIFTIIWISVGGLRMGSRRRAWSIFTLGMAPAPFAILMLEIMVFFCLFLLLVIYLTLQPDLVDQLLQVSEQLVYMTDPQAILDLLLPYLTNPFLLIIGFASLSLIIPLIEELLKPAGIWLLGRKALSAQEGFTLGILSGAAFATFESLGNSSNISSGWGMLVLARIGADLVHILGTGLMGWAIARTWQDKKYLRLLGIYLLVVLNHGLWNAQAILVGVSELAEYLPVSISYTWISPVCVVGLSIQVILMMGTLVWMNRRLRSDAEPTLQTAV